MPRINNKFMEFAFCFHAETRILSKSASLMYVSLVFNNLIKTSRRCGVYISQKCCNASDVYLFYGAAVEKSSGSIFFRFVTRSKIYRPLYSPLYRWHWLIVLEWEHNLHHVNFIFAAATLCLMKLWWIVPDR